MMNLIRNSSRLKQSVPQKLARAGLLLVVAVLCSQGQMVQAAQLGAPEIRSYLGEPLQARIALENVNAETIAAAKTSLAPPVEWARQGAGIYPEDLDLQSPLNVMRLVIMSTCNPGSRSANRCCSCCWICRCRNSRW